MIDQKYWAIQFKALQIATCWFHKKKRFQIFENHTNSARRPFEFYGQVSFDSFFLSVYAPQPWFRNLMWMRAGKALTDLGGATPPPPPQRSKVFWMSCRFFTEILVHSLEGRHPGSAPAVICETDTWTDTGTPVSYFWMHSNIFVSGVSMLFVDSVAIPISYILFILLYQNVTQLRNGPSARWTHWYLIQYITTLGHEPFLK